ncbi:hypothetical protein K7I13_07715 [Brucepastera parasyntrophica]|uniref:hypothetical protein n=1 Tax=Brucepastera parasyntrophica TaxID=2880008 RepID=UPI00210A919F|nr:hypothetical protein [Brucepastera parasyntrophica]ULQ58464.1 hypothetical protein K7I13_07715 [Brucepastera parasyntrophica]
MKKEHFSIIAIILLVCMTVLSCGSTPAAVETVPEPEPAPVVVQEPAPVVETPPPPPPPRLRPRK